MRKGIFRSQASSRREEHSAELPTRVATAGFAESVNLAAVVDVGNYDVARLIEAEKSAPLADAQAIRAFQRTLQRLDVAATVSSKHFQGVNNTCRVGAVHVGGFALSRRLIDEEPFHRPSRCFNSP